MTYLQAIILGIVQGLTEFLPISSSAHLVFVPYLLGWQIPLGEAFVFNVLVQLGTLLAVILFFARDLWRIVREWFKGIFHRKPFDSVDARLGWYLILATIPAGLLGITIKNKVEEVFQSPFLTAVLLFGTAILLIIAEKVGKRSRGIESLNLKDALWIGLFQAISIFPGISRSGATISGGMTRDLNRPGAAGFGFLMSIPIMLAAGLVGALDLRKIDGVTSFLPVMLTGFITAAIVGYLSIRWLLAYVSRRSFWPFVVYCIVVATLVIAFGFIFKPTQAQTSIEDPVITSVEVTPALTWLSPLLELCAREQPGMKLITQELPPSDEIQTEIAIRMQPPRGEVVPGIILGKPEIRFLVHPSNPVSSLDSSELRSLLQSSQPAWSDGSPVKIFTYPPGSELSSLIIAALPLDGGFSPSSKIVMHPQEMLRAVGNDSLSIGYVPDSALDASVKPIAIDSGGSQEIIGTIYAFPQREFTPRERSWITCVIRGLELQ